MDHGLSYPYRFVKIYKNRVLACGHPNDEVCELIHFGGEKFKNQTAFTVKMPYSSRLGKIEKKIKPKKNKDGRKFNYPDERIYIFV